MGVSDATDNAVARHLAQAVEREDDVRVSLPAAAVEVYGDVTDQQVGHRRIRGHKPRLAGAEGERLVATADQGSAGQDGDAALGQRRPADERRRGEGRARQVQYRITGGLGD